MISWSRSKYFILAALILALGVGAATAAFVGMLGNLGEIRQSMIRVVVPGERSVYLAEAGIYTVFFEFKSELDGRIYDSPENALDGMEFEVEDAQTGEKMPVRAASMRGTYSLGSQEGRSILAFSILKPGWYRIEAELKGLDEEGGQQFVLAVTKGFSRGVATTIGWIFGLVSTFIITIIASATLIVVGVVREKG